MSRAGANKPKFGSDDWRNTVRCLRCNRWQKNARAQTDDRFYLPCRYCGHHLGEYAWPV